jgi:hypothetical protein
MYEVVKLTGSDLIDASGRVTGPETGGVISRHRSIDQAFRSAASRSGPVAVRDENGKIVSEPAPECDCGLGDASAEWVREHKAYGWARGNQGFSGSWEDWLAMPSNERQAYEDGVGTMTTTYALHWTIATPDGYPRPNVSNYSSREEAERAMTALLGRSDVVGAYIKEEEDAD